jgi:hypothetical protein
MDAESSKSGAMQRDLDVEDLLSKLHLSEAEKDGVVLAKEDQESLPAVKWMAAAKLLTTKDFSAFSLVSTMRFAWNPAKEVTFCSIGKNLFVIQAFCLGDWKRIMEEGPWIFRGYALMLEEFDGSTLVPKVIPCKVLAWVQIHKIPHLYRTEAILKQLATKVGEVQEVEAAAIASKQGGVPPRVGESASHSAAGARGHPLRSPDRQDKIVLQVKYEKLSRFCAHYGIMGHVHLECGAGEYSEEELQFGAWMVAEAETWRPGTPRFRSLPNEGPRDGSGRGQGRPQRGGRGQSGGRGNRTPMWREKTAQASGNSGSRKRPSAGADADKVDQDLSDTASSPVKMASPATVVGETDSGARKL